MNALRRPSARPQGAASDATQEVLNRLRWRIQLSPLTQRALERRLGFSKGYLSQVLRGHVDLKMNHLFSLLEALEVAPGEFFAAVAEDPANPPRNPEEEAAFAAQESRPARLARLYSFGLQSIDDFERRLSRCEEALGEARSRGLI
jgi:transcriptional regulator with XRE-family HTH domain